MREKQLRAGPEKGGFARSHAGGKVRKSKTSLPGARCQGSLQVQGEAPGQGGDSRTKGGLTQLTAVGSRHSSTWAWHLRCWGDWLHHPKERLYPESASKTPSPGHGLHRALHRGCVQPAQLCWLHPVLPLAARRAGPGPCPPRCSPAGVTHSHGAVQREEATSRGRTVVRGAQGQALHSPRLPPGRGHLLPRGLSPGRCPSNLPSASGNECQ